MPCLVVGRPNTFWVNNSNLELKFQSELHLAGRKGDLLDSAHVPYDSARCFKPRTRQSRKVRMVLEYWKSPP